MKRVLLLSLILFTISACAASVGLVVPVGGSPGPRVSIGFFYDALAPYGDWVHVEPWGWAWTPRDAGPGWRPYTMGHWAYTSFGWTWVSDEEWGWAPYHYGRWTWDAGYGWIWIPDTVWAPSWVAWRSGNGWIGWAPLPPQVGWRVGVGLDFGAVEIGVALGPDRWCFVGERDFLAPHVVRRLEPLPRGAFLFRDTHDITRYEPTSLGVADRSLDVREVERATGRPVDRYAIDDLQRPPRRGEGEGRGAVRIYRPEVGKDVPGAPPPPEKRDLRPRRERELEQWEAEQRRELDRAQSREQRRPPPGVSPQELEQRHQTERRELDKQVDREKLRIQRQREGGRSRESAPPAEKPPQG